ncbi:MAG TPA: STAS domain-containing protein [Terriglobales bacterium]|nr:STAS domain-containing protein [Terriglobales bacterium]
METAIGVFSSRHGAEKAVKQLRQQGIPEEAIVFLTWSESEAKVVARRLAGGAADASVAIAEFLLPGMGTVFALGFGKVTLLRLAAVRAASAVGLHVMDMHPMNKEKSPGAIADVTADATSDVGSEVTSDEKSKYAAFFRLVLKEGRSLVVVRTESRELVASACVVLDRLSLGLEERTSSELRITSRVVGEAVVIDMSGRITVGEGNLLLREMVENVAESGKKNIVLNLGEVTYMDSSGLGELVKTHTTIRNIEGEVKLVNLSKRVAELLQMTKLSSVFDIYEDEASAIGSFGRQSLRQATA